MKTEKELPESDLSESDAPQVAGTLQDLLFEISDRVNLADSRYADIITEMQNKLATLDALAKSTREKAAEEARLAAEAESKREADEEAERVAEEKARKQAEEDEAEDERKRLADAVEAAKLAATAAVESSKSQSYADDIDPFDIIDHTPIRSREPWDTETANVFIRHFEQYGRTSQALEPRSPKSAQLYPSNMPALIDPPLEPANDRAWLDGRFNDIASRISEMMAANPARELGTRFDNLEGRIDAAITTVTTHATTGADTLKQIESHIAEIDDHVEFIRNELARLDGVEAQIRGLMEKHGPIEGDATKPVVSAGDANGIGHLTTLLQRLMSERKHTEEHTVSMLDTLQQAMIRVLDRMDANEGAQPVPSDATPAEADEIKAEPELLSLHHTAPSVRQAITPAAPSLDFNPARFQPDNSFLSEFDDEEEDAHADLTRAAEFASRAPANSPELQTSIVEIRRNFVADAQRARQRAHGVDPSVAQQNNNPAPQQSGPPRQKTLTASLLERLTRPSSKQLAIAALSLMIPLNCMFLYLVLGSSKSQEQVDIHTSSEELSRPSDRLTEASQAQASEPPISQASQPGPSNDASARINPSQAPAEPISLQRTDAAQPPEGRIELPPATVGPLTLRKAAADGDASAQFEVAARLAEGKGIDQDFKSAVEWYLRAASHGFAQAQYRIGTHYERGLGVEKDSDRARVWYQRAAEQGNVKAMHNLAVLCTSRPDGRQDYPEALRWFSEAAGYNLPDSQFNLAVLYENGLGTAKDPKAAYLWFALAARGGDKEAVKRRDTIKALLTGDALTAAEEEIRTFRAKPQLPVINDPRVAGEQWKKRQLSEN